MLSEFVNQILNNVVAIIFLMIVFLLFCVGVISVIRKDHDDVARSIVILFLVLLLAKCVGV